jgi:hypothetical protein
MTMKTPAAQTLTERLSEWARSLRGQAAALKAEASQISTRTGWDPMDVTFQVQVKELQRRAAWLEKRATVAESEGIMLLDQDSVAEGMADRELQDEAAAFFRVRYVSPAAAPTFIG